MKNKTMKAITAFLFISAVLLSLTACSQKTGGATEPEKTPEVTSEEPSPPSESAAEQTEEEESVPKETEIRPFTEVEAGEISIDSDAVYTTRAEGNNWQGYIYSFGEKNTGKQHVFFDVTALEDNIDASVDIADAQVEVRGFENLALMVRFSTSGVIGIQSGAAFETITPFSYTANTRYHVDIYADMNAKKYDVYITTPDGTRTKIAADYGFRNSAKAYTNDVGKMFFVSAGKGGLLRIENIYRETFKEYPAD